MPNKCAMCNEIEVRSIHQTQKKQDAFLEFEIKRIEELLEYPSSFATPHKHDFYFILFLSEGNSVQRVDFEENSIKGRQVLFMYPGQVHSFKYSKGAKGYTLYFTKDFLESKNSSVYKLHQLFINAVQVIKLNEIVEIEATLAKLYDEFQSNQVNRKGLLKAYTEVLTTTLLRRINPGVETLKAQSTFFNLLDLQEKYFNTNTEVQTICKEIGITQKKLNTVSREYFGKTFLQLLNERKLLEVKRLLTTSELSIKEIAYQTGFTDSSYLNNFFKKQLGITPLQFREKYLEIEA